MTTKNIPRVCRYCGTTFLAWPSLVRKGAAKFCSRLCTDEFRKTKYIERFWRNVKKTEGCWLWRATADKNWYGEIMVHGRKRGAHCVSYELAYGPIPEGLLVRHTCDNPPCVRPDHLEVGTVKDNTRDMIKRGRKPIFRGEQAGISKLTEHLVREIRSRHARGEKQNGLAKAYNVHTTTIFNIVHRRTWTHVP